MKSRVPNAGTPNGKGDGTPWLRSRGFSASFTHFQNSMFLVCLVISVEIGLRLQES